MKTVLLSVEQGTNAIVAYLHKHNLVPGEFQNVEIKIMLTGNKIDYFKVEFTKEVKS